MADHSAIIRRNASAWRKIPKGGMGRLWIETPEKLDTRRRRGWKWPLTIFICFFVVVNEEE